MLDGSGLDRPGLEDARGILAAGGLPYSPTEWGTSGQVPGDFYLIQKLRSEASRRGALLEGFALREHPPCRLHKACLLV